MCFGSASVHPSSTARDWNGVELFDDRVIPYLQEFSATMHRYDVPVVAQITHRGRRGRSIDLWNRLYGPSDVREPNHRENPHPLDQETIDEFVARVRRRRRPAASRGASMAARSWPAIAI